MDVDAIETKYQLLASGESADDSASRTFRGECRADGVNPAAVSSTATQMARKTEDEKATQLTRYAKRLAL